MQFADCEQVPAGRGLQSPDWQLSLSEQSMSAVQPFVHLLLMHHAPAPQSALNVQLIGRPVPASEEPLPPPVPDVFEPPPVPLVPASEPLPPPVPPPGFTTPAGAQ
jgi:hypothetical protein